MNIVLLTLASIVGPLTPSTPTAENPAGVECPVVKADPNLAAKTAAKSTPKDAKSAGRAAPETGKKPTPPAPVVRKPRRPAYLFM